MESLRPTSDSQFESFRQRTIPEIEEVGSGIFAIPLPMSQEWLGYSWSYAFMRADGSLDLFDSGSIYERAWPALENGLASLGTSTARIRTLVLSHMHDDHAGLARQIQREGAAIAMHASDARAVTTHIPFMARDLLVTRLREWNVPTQFHAEIIAAGTSPAAEIEPFEADILLGSRQRIRMGTRDLIAMNTPGQTPGHLVIIDDDNEIVFSGDHVSTPGINPGVGLGGHFSPDMVAQYLGALGALEPYAHFEVCPGHGYRFEFLGQRCSDIVGHIGRRVAASQALLREHPDLPVWDLAEAAGWTKRWSDVHNQELLTAVLQVAFQIEHGRSSLQA